MMKRWWVYQQAHFPLLRQAGLMAVFAFATVGYSAWLGRSHQGEGHPLYPLGLAAIAFLSLFLFKLQHSILHELRSVQRDWRDQGDRSISDGQLTSIPLKELEVLGIAAAVIQLGLAISINLLFIPLLLLIWGYMTAQSQDFFVSGWLRTKPFLELLSEALLMPFLALYATAFDWLVLGRSPPAGILLFLFISYCSGLLMEIGRKICAPNDEKLGVETYTMLWGRKRTVILWLSAVWLIVLATILAATQTQVLVPVVLILLFLLTGSVTLAWRFLAHPITKWATGFEFISSVWVITVYLTLGIIPWLFEAR